MTSPGWRIVLTILWEDQRPPKKQSFGAHTLLVACLADELDAIGEPRTFHEIEHVVDSVPKKGNTKVLHALESDITGLAAAGPVWAVLDKDRLRDVWPPSTRPATCFSSLCAAVRARAPGSYDLVLLVDNLETLVDACCAAVGIPSPGRKLRPEERDQRLRRLAWSGSPAQRLAVRTAVPSFDRLVKRVVGHLAFILPWSPP